MPDRETTLEYFTRQGASRRSFLKFCALTASSLALPTSAAKVIAQVLATTRVHASSGFPARSVPGAARRCCGPSIHLSKTYC